MTHGPRGRRGRRPAPKLTYRPARDEDLLICAGIWSDSIADYVGRLNQPWFGGDMEPLRRLLAHFVRTDPERFSIASDPADDDRLVGFGSATLRADVWFLGMLFVLPAFQGHGVGRRLLERILPPGVARAAPQRVEPTRPALGTATDSVQPISNALYSQYGIVPRLPVFNFVGRPERFDALGALPAGVHVRESTPDTATTDLADVGSVDRATLGYEHTADHRFLLAEGRRLFVARTERGATVAYGHCAPSGRFGPIAATDEALLAPVTRHMLEHVRAPGAYASWIPGTADGLFVALLRAGFRFESFPTLLLWDRPFADFSRYVPINLALL